MSERSRKLASQSLGRRGPRTRRTRGARGPVVIFAALGDNTRLDLMLMLVAGVGRSITQLTAGTRSSRQAVTKHLRVLESAGLVRRTRRGRETMFEPRPGSLDEARRSLNLISKLWDNALARLKAFVENDCLPRRTATFKPRLNGGLAPTPFSHGLK
jgi:DNA-binding transcriptional ArsR family regulator